MKHLHTFIILMLAVAGLSSMCYGQGPEDTPVAADEMKQVIDSVSAFMTDYYVFPDAGKEMGDLVSGNFRKGNYDKAGNHMELADALTTDLRSVTNDRHIGVRFAPQRIALFRKAEADSSNTELEDLQRLEAEHNNYYFEEAKILPGNVGYLKFNRFMDASVAGPTAIAAMNFLSNIDALIIDLRENGGGSPSLIQLISSYFFEETEHLNSFYIREGDRTQQFWTLPYVPGKKMTGTDIYILTSNFTFSGAEEFTYNLKNMKRATVVGETTGGGAHPVATHIINDNFLINIPFGKAVNPITNSNWEGTGIAPDVETTRTEAFNRAYLLALEKLSDKADDPLVKKNLQWAYDGFQGKINPVSLDEKTMKQYTGNFGPRKVTWEEGSLYYQREDRPKMKMIPLTSDTFSFEDVPYFRLKIIMENGKAVAVEGQYDDGHTDRNDRS